MNKKRAETRTVYQMEIAECGAAALGMVLDYFGTSLPLERLRVECAISRDGSKANNILRAARLHGLVAHGFKRTLEDLERISWPAIIFWRFNHYIVLEGVEGDNYYVNDPAVGHRTLSKAEFEEGFTGVVLEFEKGKDFRPEGRRHEEFSFLYEKIGALSGIISFLIVSGLLAGILLLVYPAAIMYFVDDIMITNAFEVTEHLVFILLICGSMLLGVELISNRATQIASREVLSFSSRSFYLHLLRLPLNFFSQRYSVDVARRVVGNIRLLSTIINKAKVVAFSSFALFFFLLVVSYYSWKLSVSFLAVFLLNLYVFRILIRRQKDFFSGLSAKETKLSNLAYFAFENIEDLKVNQAESSFFAEFTTASEQKNEIERSVVNEMKWINAFSHMALALSVVVLFLVGSFEVIENEMTVGMLAASVVLVYGVLNPVRNLTEIFKDLTSFAVQQKRIADISRHPEDIEFQKKHESAFDFEKLKGKISIKNLHFGYDPYASRLTVEGINLEASPGDRIALVGDSGSGKSTVAKLICGLYQPQKGELLLDGYFRNQIPKDVLVRSIGYVEQQIFLFRGTIWDNLTLFNNSANKEEVLQALNDACFENELLEELGGLGGVVERKGVNLSGGERQKLEIARALIGGPSIIVLDECMSSLDAVTEHRIDSNLKKRNITCVYIAHRLSTVKKADEIIFLQQGRIVERGRHDELLAKEKGAYRQLVSKGY